jgi:hypothetical protein
VDLLQGAKTIEQFEYAMSVEVNGTLMQRTMNFTITAPAGTDAELEAIGWKRYTENTTNVFCSKNW